MPSNKELKSGVRSWRSTTAGIAAFIAIAAPQLSALFDGDPSTIVDWNILIGGLSVLIMGFVARDGIVSSEDSGIK